MKVQARPTACPLVMFPVGAPLGTISVRCAEATGDVAVQGRDGAGQGPTLCGDEATAQAAALDITVVTDADYRCVWRPCLALEEEEGGETG